MNANCKIAVRLGIFRQAVFGLLDFQIPYDRITMAGGGSSLFFYGVVLTHAAIALQLN